MAALPEECGTLEPWGGRQTKQALRRWWEMRQAGAHSGGSWAMQRQGAPERIAREYCCTVAYWVEATHRGARRTFPDQSWGRVPIVMRWLEASSIAAELYARANAEQRKAFDDRTLKSGAVRGRLDVLWRQAERASTIAHRVEHSRGFGIALGFLGTAFAMCANEDWTWRRLEEAERDPAAL